MPYVNVKITKDGVSSGQKRKLVEDITRSLVVTLGKKPEHIHIVIDEVAPENWGFAGMLTPDYRASTGPSKRTTRAGPAITEKRKSVRKKKA